MKPIGILGGMGPGAGVYFKQLIVDMTPAGCDQEHIPIILYTNPQIPDRTTAIQQGTRGDFIEKVVSSLLKLEAFGVAELFIPCNTSFVGYEEYCKNVDTPIYHLPRRTVDAVSRLGHKRTLLLATSGTYAANVYSHQSVVAVEYPGLSRQSLVHELITAVKSGDVAAEQRCFRLVIESIPKQCESVILGCTELSMLAGKFRIARPEIVFVDPLEIAAKYIVDTYSRIPVAAGSHSQREAK